MTCNIQLMFLLLLCPAWAEVFMWQPPSLGNSLEKRAGGYRPEYNDCGEGHDCSSCGDEFEQCAASTTLVLFCYNPTAGQTCCPNGQGKACNAGYYCATDGSGRTWCCLNVRPVTVLSSSPGFFPSRSSPIRVSQKKQSRLTIITHRRNWTSRNAPPPTVSRDCNPPCRLPRSWRRQQ